MHLPLVDVAACFDNLEPAQVLDGFVRTLNGLINGVLDGSGRGAGEFDEFIDWIFHTRFFRYRRRTVSVGGFGRTIGGPGWVIGGPGWVIDGPARVIGGPGRVIGGPSRVIGGPGRVIGAECP